MFVDTLLQPASDAIFEWRFSPKFTTAHAYLHDDPREDNTYHD